MALEMLVEILDEDGQYEEALRETERGMERFGDISFDRVRVKLLAGSGDRDGAAGYAMRLLARQDLSVEQRVMLHRSIVAAANLRGHWPAVEQHSRTALGEFPDDHSLQWAYIGAAANLQRGSDAWARLQQLAPPIVHASSLPVWLGLHAQFGFTATDIDIALDTLETTA
jgi:hypothetical protein